MAKSTATYDYKTILPPDERDPKPGFTAYSLAMLGILTLLSIFFFHYFCIQFLQWEEGSKAPGSSAASELRRLQDDQLGQLETGAMTQDKENPQPVKPIGQAMQMVIEGKYRK